MKRAAILTVFAVMVSALPASAAPKAENPGVAKGQGPSSPQVAAATNPVGAYCSGSVNAKIPVSGPVTFRSTCTYYPGFHKVGSQLVADPPTVQAGGPKFAFGYIPGGCYGVCTDAHYRLAGATTGFGSTVTKSSMTISRDAWRAAGSNWVYNHCVSYFMDPNQATACNPVTQSMSVSLGSLLGTCGGTTGILAGFLSGLCTEDPVNTATGSYESSATDLSANTAFGIPLGLSRTYNSIDPSSGSFGPGWSSILDTGLFGAVAAPGSTTPGIGTTKRLYSHAPKKAGTALFYGDDFPPAYDAVTGEFVDVGSTFTSASSVGVANYSVNAKPNAGGALFLRLPGGGQHTFGPGYQADGITYATPPGVRASLVDTPSGYRLTTDDQRSYQFNSDGELIKMADRLGNGLTFTYDNGQPETITDASGTQITLDYEGDLLAGASLSDGRSVSYGYTDGRLSSVTDAASEITTYGYDADGLLEQIVNQAGDRVVFNVYDDQGRVVAQTDAENNTGRFNYDTPGLTIYTDALGHSTTSRFSGHVLQSTTDAEGGVTTYVRDASLDLIEVIDPRGKSTKMTYTNHDLRTVTGPSGTNISASFDYNANHDLTRSTDGRGAVTNYGYNSAGLLRSIDGPGSVDTLISHDPTTGLVTSTTNPNLHTTGFEYGSDGRLDSVIPPLGPPTTFAYDAAGRLAHVTEPRGNRPGADPAEFTSDIVYDNLDRMVATRDALDNQTSYLYDPAGRLCRMIDAIGTAALTSAPVGCEDQDGLAGETVYERDGRGLVTTIVTSDGSRTQMAYDAVSNLLSSTDANSHVTSYVYDDANRITHVQTPQTNRDFTYLPGGLPETVTLADGQITTASYDNASRLVGIDYSDPDTADLGYEYDANSNRTRMTDGLVGAETYTYDELNRLTSISRPSVDTISYVYDNASNITKRIYGAREIDYGFDANQRLESVTQGGVTTSYDYDAAGRLETTTYPGQDPWHDDYSYDAAGRLEDVSTSRGTDVMNSFAYARDAVGNPTQISSTGRMDHQVLDTAVQTPDETTHFTYDELYRLTGECYNAQCDDNPTDYVSYTYDAMGNRLSETSTYDYLGNRLSGTPETFTYTYNDADQLIQTSKPYGHKFSGGWQVPRELSYDVNGNLVSDGDVYLEYDQAGSRTRRYSTAPLRYELYSYDGNGTRTHTELTQSYRFFVRRFQTSYLWDPNFSLPMMVSSTQTEQNRPDITSDQTYGNGLISSTQGPQTLYMHPDGIGSVAGLSDQDGTPISRMSYSPFGEDRGTQVLDQTAQGSTPFGFAGEYQDEFIGLYHLRARQYDPTIGRFTTPDPLGGQISTGTYGYAGNRPGVLVDPSGLAGERPASDTYTNCTPLGGNDQNPLPNPYCGGEKWSPAPTGPPPSPSPVPVPGSCVAGHRPDGSCNGSEMDQCLGFTFFADVYHCEGPAGNSNALGMSISAGISWGSRPPNSDTVEATGPSICVWGCFGPKHTTTMYENGYVETETEWFHCCGFSLTLVGLSG